MIIDCLRSWIDLQCFSKGLADKRKEAPTSPKAFLEHFGVNSPILQASSCIVDFMFANMMIILNNVTIRVFTMYNDTLTLY